MRSSGLLQDQGGCLEAGTVRLCLHLSFQTGYFGRQEPPSSSGLQLSRGMHPVHVGLSLGALTADRVWGGRGPSASACPAPISCCLLLNHPLMLGTLPCSEFGEGKFLRLPLCELGRLTQELLLLSHVSTLQNHPSLLSEWRRSNQKPCPLWTGPPLTAP